MLLLLKIFMVKIRDLQREEMKQLFIEEKITTTILQKKMQIDGVVVRTVVLTRDSEVSLTMIDHMIEMIEIIDLTIEMTEIMIEMIVGLIEVIEIMIEVTEIRTLVGVRTTTRDISTFDI